MGFLPPHPQGSWQDTSWPPASTPACLWVTPGARPDAVTRPRGPSAFLSFVSDDVGSTEKGRGGEGGEAMSVRGPFQDAESRKGSGAGNPTGLPREARRSTRTQAPHASQAWAQAAQDGASPWGTGCQEVAGLGQCPQASSLLQEAGPCSTIRASAPPRPPRPPGHLQAPLG